MTRSLQAIPTPAVLIDPSLSAADREELDRFHGILDLTDWVTRRSENLLIGFRDETSIRISKVPWQTMDHLVWKATAYHFKGGEVSVLGRHEHNILTVFSAALEALDYMLNHVAQEQEGE
jgi:hypothetical protein